MKIINYIYFVLFAFCLVLYSCKENKSNNTAKITVQNKEIKKENIQEKEMDSILLNLFNNLNLLEIKQKYGATSGVLSNKDREKYFLEESIEQGLLGFYFFVDTQDPNIDVFAKCVIFTPNKDWYASDKDEKILELTI